MAKKTTLIRYLSVSEFNSLKEKLSTLMDFDESEQYGMTLTIGDTIHIIICDDPSLTSTERKVILWHEKAHASGIDNEEDADIWALKNLDKKSKELLIDNWEHRHGHPYKG